MAFQSGTQVNAALGRTDYTPFLQGALQGAQSQGRAGELIGQGLANLGQQVATNVEKYYKKEEEKKLNEQAVDTIGTIFKSNPELASQMGIQLDASGNFDKKLGLSLIKTFGGAAPTIQIANTLRELGVKKAEDTQTAQQFNALRQSGGRAVSPNSGPISPMAEMKGYETYAKYLETQSQIDKNLREKAGVQGVEMTQEQVNNIPAGTDFKGTPLANGKIFVTGLSRFAPGAQTNINMGENAYDKRGGEVMFDKDLSEYEAASAAPDRLEKLDTVLDLIKEGNITTGFGAELAQNANRMKAKFLNDKEAGKTVTNTDLLDSLLSSDVFPMISSLGIGAKGMDTPAERDFLRQAFTGTKELSPETLQRLTEIRRNIEIRNVKKFKQNYDKGTYKRFFDKFGRPLPDFSSIPPEGVTFKEWSNMTLEDKALWNK
jgi:hypothetical protein